ncbi:MAG: hypothetical protein ACOZNI_28225 [Myxococcota bacterium]
MLAAIHLARALRELGRPTEAAEALHPVLTSWGDRLNDETRARGHWWLAVCSRDAKRFDWALTSAVHAAAVLDEEPVAEPIGAAEMRAIAGDVLADRKEWGAAARHLERAVSLRRRVDPRGRELSRLLHRYGQALISRRQHAQAASVLRECVGLREARALESPADLAASLIVLGRALVRASQRKDGAASVRRGVDLTRAIAPHRPAWVAETLRNAVVILREAAMHEEAARTARQGLQVLGGRLPADDPFVRDLVKHIRPFVDPLPRQTRRTGPGWPRKKRR